MHLCGLEKGASVKEQERIAYPKTALKPEKNRDQFLPISGKASAPKGGSK
jgi:hypothetical protein